MTKRVLVGALLVFALVGLAGARRAQACGGGGATGVVVLGLAGIAAIDLTLSIADVTTKEPSRGYGALELLLTAPQAVFLGSLAAQTLFSPQPSVGSGLIFLGLTAWTGALAIHGGFALFGPRQTTGDGDEQRRQARSGIRWGTAPTMLSTERTRAAPGAVLFGRF
jgi:hypothetical protein